MNVPPESIAHRVLHLIDSGGLYGAEKMLLSLVEHQLRQGLAPTILSAGQPDEGEKAIETAARTAGLPLIAWRMRPGLNLRESRRILAWARDGSFDLLHSHGYKFNVLMSLWPRGLRKLPLVATLHGYTRGPLFSKHWFYERSDRAALFGADRVVLVATSMRNNVPASIARSPRTAVIPNGIDVARLMAERTLPLEETLASFCNRHDPVLLGVGRLSPEKGFGRLVDVMPLLRRLHPNIGLVLIGEGPQRPLLEARARECGVADALLMPGFIGAVPALMSRTDVLCMPSITEGLPITLLEGMTTGIPTCVTAVGEMPEALGHGQGGLILESTQPAEMAAALSAYLLDPERQRAHVAWSRNRVEADYSAERMAARYRNLYDEVIGS